MFARSPRIHGLFEGRGKLGVGEDGRTRDTSSSGYDATLLSALIAKGVTDECMLATVLYHRPDGAAAAKRVEREIGALGMNVERYVPIMAWQWSHLALVIPLAGAAYVYDCDTARVVADRALLKRTMRCASAAFRAVERADYPILPRGLRMMKYIPAWLGARRIGQLLDSDFGRIAIAGHAKSARDEMHAIAQDFLSLAGDSAGPELSELLGPI